MSHTARCGRIIFLRNIRPTKYVLVFPSNRVFDSQFSRTLPFSKTNFSGSSFSTNEKFEAPGIFSLFFFFFVGHIYLIRTQILYGTKTKSALTPLFNKKNLQIIVEIVSITMYHELSKI